MSSVITRRHTDCLLHTVTHQIAFVIEAAVVHDPPDIPVRGGETLEASDGVIEEARAA
jgi:hypothetical protein